MMSGGSGRDGAEQGRRDGRFAPLDVLMIL